MHVIVAVDRRLEYIWRVNITSSEIQYHLKFTSSNAILYRSLFFAVVNVEFRITASNFDPREDAGTIQYGVDFTNQDEVQIVNGSIRVHVAVDTVDSTARNGSGEFNLGAYVLLCMKLYRN